MPPEEAPGRPGLSQLLRLPQHLNLRRGSRRGGRRPLDGTYSEHDNESDDAMTQQPYYPQQYPPPQYPQQPPVQQGPPGWAQPQWTPPGQPMQQPYANGYGQPQGYPGPGQQAPQGPPPAPIASGTLDDFYSQPSAAGGPGISWKNKPDGTAYAGVISGKCRVQQDTDFDTGRPLFQRDQVTPKWVMLIPLSQVQTNAQGPVEYPDGEAVFYVRGQAKDELARAMAEAHCSGEPAEGATFQVTLTHRKPNRKGNPSNMVAIRYVPPNGVPHQAPQAGEVQQNGQSAEVPAPAAAPASQPALQPVPQPMAQQAPAPQPVAQPVQQQWQAQQAQQMQPVQQQAPAPQVGQLQPMQQQALPPQPPPGLNPEQQAMLAQLGAQQTAQQAG